MSRRYRHFNAKGVGASVVLDSRFITGKSNGNAISTWSDRSENGYNATQGTTGSQPTYQTNIIGGNPAVYFSGSKSMATGNIGSVQLHSFICVSQRTGANTNAGSNLGFIIAIGASGSLTNRASQLAYDDTSGGVFGTYVYNVGAATITRNNNWNIHSSLIPRGSGNVDYRINGGTSSTLNIASLGGATNCIFDVGAPTFNPGYNANMIGYVTMSILFKSIITSSVRKRIEQSAAYAFKIACS